MVAFTSARERRLWTAAFFVVAGIYATLGLARTLSDELRARGLVDAVWVTGLVVLAVVIGSLALRTRPGRREVLVAIGIAAVYLMLFARLAIPEERTHLIEYSLVAVLILEALRERASGGERVPNPSLLAVGTTATLGTVDELIQLFIPSRVFDPVDVAFNVLAAVLAVVGTAVLRRARQAASS